VQEEKDSLFSFSKFYRIRRSQDIKALFHEGKRIESKTFIMYYKENFLPYPRIAIITSRKVGKAVFRNKLRRYVREIFRKNKDLFRAYDHVVIFKRKLTDITYKDFYIELKKVLENVRES
jgi:ribonuclease P protein component